MVAGGRSSLMVQGGPSSGMTIELAGRPVTLGRRGDNDVMVEEDTVSRRHALIMETPAGYVLRDLNSTNGTFVNRSKLGLQEHTLKHGDQIRLAGSKVTFVFREEGSDTRKMTVGAPVTGAIQLGADMVKEPLPAEEPEPEPEPEPAEKETQLLRLLESRRGNVVNREEIFRAVWPELPAGPEVDEEIDRTVESLRGQIEEDPSKPTHLVTVGEFGFLLI